VSKLIDFFKLFDFKISNFDKINRPNLQNMKFLTSGLEIYAIWVKCLVNKLSQITDVKSGFICRLVTQIR